MYSGMAWWDCSWGVANLVRLGERASLVLNLEEW